MSFTVNLKQEVAYNDLKPCCAKAELSALIQLCSSLTISNRNLVIVIQTENPTTAKRIFKLIKNFYDIETELSVIKKAKLNKNHIYILKILNKAKQILTDLGIYGNNGLSEYPSYDIVSKKCCARAYLAGAFMATGSCNSPVKSNYHLEIATTTKAHAEFLVRLMARFDLPAKVILRRKKYVVYIKSAEKIADFLRCIGAQQGLLEFENIRINRDFKNSLTRLDNCDLANEMKSLKASSLQVEDINKIINANLFETLNQRLKDVAKLRLEYSEYSLKELCKVYESVYGNSISKSGLKHRFVKIHEIAERISE